LRLPVMGRGKPCPYGVGWGTVVWGQPLRLPVMGRGKPCPYGVGRGTVVWGLAVARPPHGRLGRGHHRTAAARPLLQCK